MLLNISDDCRERERERVREREQKKPCSWILLMTCYVEEPLDADEWQWCDVNA